MSEKKKVRVRTYHGSQSQATKLFREDAKKLEAEGYFPTSQNWAAGSYGCGSFIVALLLCFILIGIIVFIYMLVVPPSGSLSVTYELREQKVVRAEKQCPKCAEDVKLEAKICRYCNHEFET